MPELPEVETVRRGLQPAMEGAKIVKAEVRRKDLRFPFQKDFVRRLEDQTVTGLGRRAKYLMADLSSGDVLLMHLGMSGSFRVLEGDGKKTPGQFHHPRTDDRAHDHVVFHMSSGTEIVFNDPRRFGYMKIIARRALDEEPLLKGLGPEPLGNEFDAAMLARSCANRKTSLKAALLDQRVVAGLGNIYVCEALFRAHLSPRRLAATLATRKGEPTDHAKRLVEAIHGGAQSGHQGRRLVAAGSSPDLGRTRLLPAFVSGLRPRGRTMPNQRLWRGRSPVHPERPLDLLVSEVPEVKV
jgi:formamidopyrimidine-DNA glycosylase